MIVAGTKGWTCKGCQREVQTYRLLCAQCGQEKSPSLSAKPAQYVCQLCLAGGSEGRRESGRKAGLRSQALRRAKIASQA